MKLTELLSLATRLLYAMYGYSPLAIAWGAPAGDAVLASSAALTPSQSNPSVSTAAR